MKYLKRVSEFNVEFISNGFIVSYNGYNENDEWESEKFYASTMLKLKQMINIIDTMNKDK